MVLRFEPNDYGPQVASLLRSDADFAFGPGQPNHPLFESLHELTLEAVFAGQAVADPEMARACLSALWLRHNFLDESHTISQGISTSTGSFWHGIMHRREPDYSNAKYWFRRVEDHPVYAILADGARRLAEASDFTPAAEFFGPQTDWDPFRFVDFCEAAARAPAGPEGELCAKVTQLEWQLLFDYCYRRALGA